MVDFREENLVPLNLAPQISNANLMIRMEMFSIELNELGIVCDVNLGLVGEKLGELLVDHWEEIIKDYEKLEEKNNER